MIQLELIEHDYIRILTSQYYKQMSRVERSMLDLESWASGSIPTRGNGLSQDFFVFP